MKTTEERAKEYAHQYRRDVHDLKGERADAAFAAYCQGAEDKHKELTRWHDPKEELPEYIKVVEVKYKAFNKIMMAIAFRLGDLWSGKNKWCIDGTSVRIDHENILGWREIQE